MIFTHNIVTFIEIEQLNVVYNLSNSTQLQNWVIEINQAYCKGYESKVNHNKVVDIEIEKVLRVTCER